VRHVLLIEFVFEVRHLIRAQRTNVNDFVAGVDDLGFDFGRRRVAGLMMDWRRAMRRGRVVGGVIPDVAAVVVSGLLSMS
jgi:hypothetical protein